MVFQTSHRALLTETLPYEVPVIFSNERLYASSQTRPNSDGARRIVDRMRSLTTGFTIPYVYNIRKDGNRLTTLSIVHPNFQTSIAEFYDRYHQSIISYCDRSPAALRKPISLVDVFAEKKVSKGGTLKLGIPHINAADGETEAGHVTSYFAYGRYNLLGKFIDSREFRDLEKRYKRLRTIDISKCFYHIYTHSVTWAAKGKAYAKSQAEVYSFEGRFDRLMQEANYNETNGIVVGPEVSRIFAEIILQDVDVSLLQALPELTHGIDYDVRRYVDDYFVFGDAQETLDRVQRTLEQCLERYKLFLNNAKTETKERPFVTSIMLARGDIAKVIAGLHQALNDLIPTDGRQASRKAREVAQRCAEVRLVCERYSISMGTVSGWLLSQMRVIFRRSLKTIRSHKDEALRDIIEDISSSLIDAVFYIASLDLRVRSTYSICHLLHAAARLRGQGLEARSSRLLHQSEMELVRLLQLAQRDGPAEGVELFNLLIAGAHFIGPRFLQNSAVSQIVELQLRRPQISYYAYISLKFCFLKDLNANATSLGILNARVTERLAEVAKTKTLGRDSESYLLACDFVSAPDVALADKRAVLQDLIGGQDGNSNDEIIEAGKHLAFADWEGLRIQHLLARKELRPVYAWA